MGSSPRTLSLLVLGLVVPAAQAADVTALVAAVAKQTRFAVPAVATGTLVHRGDAGETRRTIRIAGRRATLRVDVGTDRALVRLGKALVRGDDGALRLTDEGVIARSNVRLGDLSIFTTRSFENPQIVDQGLSGTVIAAAPAGTSPYALLVVTIDPARAVATQAKYYEYTINNMTKRDQRSDFVDVAGALRPTHLTMWDVQGSGTTELDLTWHAAPDLGRAPFTRAGLSDPLAP